MRESKSGRGILIGVLVAALTLGVLNLSMPFNSVAQAQDGDTPTPVAVVPTVTPTPAPTFGLETSAGLAVEGDVNGDGEVNPGDTINYAVTVTNTSANDSGPVEVVILFDLSFVTTVNIVTEGGLTDTGAAIWAVDAFPAGEQLNFSINATLRRNFPAGRSTVAARAVVRIGAQEMAKEPFRAFDVDGPNLRITNEEAVLVTDTDGNERIDPGDTIRVTVFYSNTGGGPSQERLLVVELPEEQTKSVEFDPDKVSQTGNRLLFPLGSVPADGEERSVEFTAFLTEEFPAGQVSYDLNLFITDASGNIEDALISDTFKVDVSGPSLILNTIFEILEDNDANDVISVGDRILVLIQVKNVGTDSANNVELTTRYNPNQLSVTDADIGESSALDSEKGIVVWEIVALAPDETREVAFEAEVDTLPVSSEEIEFKTSISSDELKVAEQPVTAGVTGPTPTPTPTMAATAALVFDSSLPQGTGIISASAVTILIGGFLVLSMFAILYVGSKVLPQTSQERVEVDTEEDKAAQRRLVRELIEGVILTAILFTVMVLGLQNTLDADSVNSIIAGIVGYVAGRVSSR